MCLCDKERESRFWFGSDPKIWVSSLLAIRNGHSRKKELRVSERESVRKERERERENVVTASSCDVTKSSIFRSAGQFEYSSATLASQRRFDALSTVQAISDSDWPRLAARRSGSRCRGLRGAKRDQQARACLYLVGLDCPPHPPLP